MEQVLYKLPDHWQWETMGNISKIVGGGTPKSSVVEYFFEGNIPWITPADLSGYKEKYISSGARFITELGLNNSSARLLPKNTVLFTSRAPIGYVAIAKNEIATNQGFKSFILEAEKATPEYIYYWLKANKELAESYANGATFLELSGAKAKLLPVPLAPINEQKRIVEKLDALLTRIDTAIEHLQESITLADALYASELNEIFPSDADIESLSDLVCWVSLADICTFENGDRGKNYPSKSAFVAEGIPVVSAGNLGERYIEHKGLNYITPERYDLLKSGRVRIGDILFCLRGSLGKVAISKDIDKGVIASSLVIVRPKESVLAEYVYKYLKSSLCQQFISFYNNGAAQPNLSAKNLGKFMLPLPNIEEQKVIVDSIDEKYQLNQKLLNGLRSKINSLQELKSSILDSAFKGEL